MEEEEDDDDDDDGSGGIEERLLAGVDEDGCGVADCDRRIE